jgi:hypothetical protein
MIIVLSFGHFLGLLYMQYYSVSESSPISALL